MHLHLDAVRASIAVVRGGGDLPTVRALMALLAGELEVTREVAQELRAAATGQAPPEEAGQDAPLFEEVATRWLEQTRATVDEATHARYADAVRLYLEPAFTGLRITQLRRRRIKAWLIDRLAEKRGNGAPRYARSTVRIRMLGVLSNLLQWAVDEEFLRANPARELGRKLFRRKKGEATKPRAMTEDQVARWTFAVETEIRSGRTYLGLMLMLDGALRIGEMVGLRLEDFDFDAGIIHIRRQVRASVPDKVVVPPKTERGVRAIRMSARIRTLAKAEFTHRREVAMAAGVEPCQWVAWDFDEAPTQKQADLARKHYETTMRHLCVAAGIGRFTPHSLRHTFGTILADHGASAKALQSWYGHASPAQTEQYIKAARPAIEDHNVNLLAEIAEGRRPRGAVPFESAEPTSRGRARRS